MPSPLLKPGRCVVFLAVATHPTSFLAADLAAEPARPLERIEYGDGTWSYVRTDAAAIGDADIRGAVTWEYAEQVRFAVGPVPVTARMVTVESGWREFSPAGLVVGASRIDNEGGRWTAVDVDSDALRLELTDIIETAASAAGVEVDDDIMVVEESVWVEGETFWWEPLIWTNHDCSSPDITYHLHDSDDDR